MRISTMTSKPVTVTVELLIFSGRPNPNWSLTSQQVKELLETVNQLPPTTASLPPDQLGYSGFMVQVANSATGSLTIQVFRGVVAVTTKGNVVHYQDAKRAVEHWLLHTATTQLDAELNNLVVNEIDKQE